jgi:hypothetical protein
VCSSDLNDAIAKTPTKTNNFFIHRLLNIKTPYLLRLY